MEVSPTTVVAVLVVVVLVFALWVMQSPGRDAPKSTPPPAQAAPERPPTPKVLPTMTLEELSTCDGADGRRLLIAVNGDVFDLLTHPSGRDLYTKPSGYAVFAGKDASVGLGMMEVDPKKWKAKASDLTASEYDTMIDWWRRFDQKYTKVAKLQKQ